jgi:hypothetical protein
MGSSDLNKTLERLGTLLTSEVEAWEKRTRPQRHRAMDHLTAELSRALDRRSARAARREAKHARRAARREAARDHASYAGGAVALALAACFVVMALTRPDLWWLVFVALGVGANGARQLGLARARDQQLPHLDQTKQPAPSHEVDVLCDQLLGDLKASPEAVRTFVQRPEETVEALRATAKALDARRTQLASEDPKARLEALVAQRSELSARINAAVDPIARAKFQEAQRSLEGQALAITALQATLERVDGEYTSLLIALQELKTRVMLARSTSSASQLGGLQQSVARLNAELEAITESLEAVAAPGHASATSGHGSAASGHASAASGHGSAASGHGSAASGHVSAASGHGSAASGHVSAASSHVSAASGHVSAASGHVSAVSGHVSAASGRAAGPDDREPKPSAGAGERLVEPVPEPEPISDPGLDAPLERVRAAQVVQKQR